MTNIKGLDPYEQKMLTDLQTIQYQGLPLINLVIKNYRERGLTDEQIAKGLEELHDKGVIVLNDYFFSRPPVAFDRLIVAHFQSLHQSQK